MTYFTRTVVLLLLGLMLLSTGGMAETKVVMLGTGTPLPDAERAGPSVAIVHNDQAYLFDVGAGSVRRAIEASERYQISALKPQNIKNVFITHMHSDHTADLAELSATLWWRRKGKVNIWGPDGIEKMVAGMYQMFAPDVDLRASGTQPIKDRNSYKSNVSTIKPGVVFDRNGVKVEAFLVNHGEVSPAYGYRISTPNKTIVISGDTAYSENLIAMAKGADILVHEVISNAGIARQDEFWQDYHRSSHTPADQLGKIASQVKPGTLVLYHMLFYGVSEEVLHREVEESYQGVFFLANDLDIY